MSTIEATVKRLNRLHPPFRRKGRTYTGSLPPGVRLGFTRRGNIVMMYTNDWHRANARFQVPVGTILRVLPAIANTSHFDRAVCVAPSVFVLLPRDEGAA